MSHEISRRDFLKALSVGSGAFVLGSSGLIPISESLLKTSESAAAQLGTFPREETLITRILTGRVGTPDNFRTWQMNRSGQLTLPLAKSSTALHLETRLITRILRLSPFHFARASHGLTAYLSPPPMWSIQSKP
jgi:hypothetical protein